jgi:hypothetical protein
MDAAGGRWRHSLARKAIDTDELLLALGRTNNNISVITEEIGIALQRINNSGLFGTYWPILHAGECEGFNSQDSIGYCAG